MDEKKIDAALFDLDGVVFDTEPQYSVFWKARFDEYYPGSKNLEHEIKGQTLVQIYDHYFAGKPEVQANITGRLNDFETNMKFEYIAGLCSFIDNLKSHGVKTAVVTSSNKAKMESVYKQCPSIKDYFDVILTSEDFTRSKPFPDCYLKGAEVLGTVPDRCVVLEDSFNGLKSGRAAGMSLIGLATTNSAESISPFADMVISDYEGMDYEKVCNLCHITEK